MRHTLRSLIATLLCLCICLSLAVPAFAANTKGIDFTAKLDKTAFTVSKNAQTVTMDIVASAPVTVDGIGGIITWDSALELTDIANTENDITFESARMNLDTGLFGWSASDGENVTNVTSIAQATFTIPANTPAGTYTVGIKELELTEGYGTVWEKGAVVTASFTIAEPVVAEGYTIALSTLTPSPVHDSTFSVDVNVTHKASGEEAVQTHFAAGQFHVTFDNTALTLNSVTAKQTGSNMTTNQVVSGNTTTVKVADFGADKLLGSGVYTLNFTAAAPGRTDLTLSSAGFTTKENATVRDLEEAAFSEAGLSINVLKKTFTVTLPEYGFGTDAGTTVTDGESFTFYITDPHYDYGTVYVSVNGGEPAALAPNADGSYTIPAVTGNVVITTQKQEARSYAVTINGEYASGEKTAKYMTDYSFTLNADKQPDLTAGYTYKVSEITIGGEGYSGFTSEGLTYTIPGKDIKGDIVITIEKTTQDRAYVSVTYEGHTGSVADRPETAEYNKPFTLTLDKIAGYLYAVEATMGGEPVTLTEGDEGTYTVEKVTGDLHFTITRTVNTGGVSVNHYLTLNGNNMYLVLEDPEEIKLDEKHIPTYDGVPMYWSDRYNAYCYLVIAETLSLTEAEAKIERTQLSETVTKEAVKYDMDVNMTGRVDAADAQLVYNMYSKPDITAFTAELPMLKFLEADVAGDGYMVDTNDAVAIINRIIGITAAN